ncbi:DUF6114 domain-containing protein [Micromonospora sp. GCM10011542]|uniref:DUF6114 domain-containing protein n=1 Tax=Micromonospora sp. GCM10011542 TaxID=3317337 RepID=UPI00360B6A56
MTTANPSHARPGGPAQAWRSFRRWRQSRPFWGGLIVALAGVEMFGSTRMTLNGLSFHSGATGLLSLLIPVILVTCGLLLWFTPAQRLFYSIVAAVTAVYSLIGLNLSGFFLGLLLGIVGSALAFAWTPTAAPGPERTGAEASASGDPARSGSDDPDLTDELMAGSGARDATPGSPQGEDTAAGAGVPPERPGGSGEPRAFAVALVVLGLSATGLVATQPRPVRAAPTLPVAAACPTPSRASTPSTPPSRSPSPATPTVSPGPQPEQTSGGNVITDILDGIGDLLTGGGRKDTATPSARPTITPTASPIATPTASPTGRPTPRPGSTACPAPQPTRPGAPTAPGKVEPGKPLPRIAADRTLPKVAQTPSKLTGSKVTMTGLRFDGITDLRTEKGTLKVLKFSMRQAVTDDFLLRADGPEGRTQRYATDRLTVRGNVAFYATRFVGRLLGIKITLTPDLPLPGGIPITSPIPITFTDPVIDLAYVTSDTLTARPALALTLG